MQVGVTRLACSWIVSSGALSHQMTYVDRSQYNRIRIQMSIIVLSPQVRPSNYQQGVIYDILALST